MRTFKRAIFAFALGAIPVAGPGFGFDGAPVNPQDTAIPVVSPQPGSAAALKRAATPIAPAALPNSNSSVMFLLHTVHTSAP